MAYTVRSFVLQQAFLDLPFLVDDSPLIPPAGLSPFANLDSAVALKIIDYLSYWDVSYLRATSRYFRALPKPRQIHRALTEFDNEIEQCRKLLFTFEPQISSWILQGLRETHHPDGTLIETDDYLSRDYLNKYRILGDWIVSTTELGIPKSHALMLVKKRLSLSLTRCDECLHLKEAEQFDLSQFGTGGSIYELLQRLDWITFRQWCGLHLSVTEPVRRICLSCRFRNVREAREIGWIREVHEPRWQIICSGCSRREFFLNSTHDFPRVCDCTGDHACRETPHIVDAFGVYASTRRMLSGKLCTRCFVEANAKWFARKKQLKAEIAERDSELWSMEKEDER